MTEINKDDDVWDDDLLIQDYHKSVRRVDKRIEEISAGLSEFNQNNADLLQNEAMKKDKRKNKRKEDSKELLWKPGDNCIAVFKEDGNEYEAKIVSVDHKYGYCVVKYIGYGNEELQYLQDLKPSRGLEAQNEQENFAKSCVCPEVNLENNLEGATSETEQVEESSPEFVLPPPPPVFLTANLTEPLAKENDALASMLMSWYMCGYQTGYYTAIKQMKQKE